ncbi:MAG: hypothetical protein ABR613_11725 [Actinomycetota bacterium]
MSAEQYGPTVFLVGYAVMFLLAIKAFGLRRVLWGVALVAFLAVAVAFKTLGVIAGGRRY